MRLRNALRLWALRALLSLMPDDEEVTQEWRPIRPWTPVHSQHGKFTHMSHNGRDTLCGVRLRTMVASEHEVDCIGCHQALSFN